MGSRAIRRVMRGIMPLVDALYPPRCAGGGHTGSVLCDACLVQIAPLPLPICPRCGIPVPQPALCRECQRRQPRITAVRAMSVYQEPLRVSRHAK